MAIRVPGVKTAVEDALIVKSNRDGEDLPRERKSTRASLPAGMVIDPEDMVMLDSVVQL